MSLAERPIDTRQSPTKSGSSGTGCRSLPTRRWLIFGDAFLASQVEPGVNEPRSIPSEGNSVLDNLRQRTAVIGVDIETTDDGSSSFGDICR